MFAVPSKDTPCIVLAFANAVAVSANPTEIFAVPSKLVPPIVLAVAKAVAVDALPVTAPSKFATRVPVVTVKLPVLARYDEG